MNISNLIIEVTRKCNMNCGHCLRGCSQGVDINNQYITDVLEKIKSIGSVTFTGGEPMLNPSAISHFERLCIDVGHFYIATNGKEMTNEFMRVVLDLYLICDWKESCLIEVSNDFYHDVEGQQDSVKEMVMAFRFGGIKGRREDNSMLFEGNFKEINSDNGNYVTPEEYDFENGDINGGLVYINALGNLINGCDWSYESQDKDMHIICKSSEFSLEAFKDYVMFSQHSEV